MFNNLKNKKGERKMKNEKINFVSADNGNLKLHWGDPLMDDTRANFASNDVNALANEQSLTEIRTKRNTLLAESDWVMLSDVVLSNIDEWRAYRQALRDLPQTITDYNNVTYPEKPS